jgi:two-component system cell cycle response regulator CpdR
MASILIAEDDDSMRHFLARALQRAGHDVVAVGHGRDALPVLAERRFDLLLADIVMPEMDGIELAQRASVADPALRVMFITGFAAVALNRRAGTAKPARVLSKPFHLRDLVEEINRALAEPVDGDAPAPT